MGRILAMVLSLVLLVAAIGLKEYDTVSSLNRMYSGKGLGKGLIMLLYSTIGQYGTMALVIGIALALLLLQFDFFGKFLRRLFTRNHLDREK